MKTKFWASLCLSTVAGSGANASPEEVQALFSDQCLPCHSLESNSGGLGFITDLERLKTGGLVVPGEPDLSLIYQRLSTAEPALLMPPRNSLSDDQITLVRNWIAEGASSGSPQGGEEGIVRMEDATPRIEGYLERRSESGVLIDRERFLLGEHLKASHTIAEIKGALSQLLGSLTWETTPIELQEVSRAPLIYAFNLDDIGWKKSYWDQISVNYPYDHRGFSAALRNIRRATGAEQPVLRADWVANKALTPPLYYKILELPQTTQDLEARLNLDFLRDYRRSQPERRTLLRAGFRRSGVSRFNRIIERRVSPYGAYWQSYDFGSNADDKQVSAFPLGPGLLGVVEETGENLSFKHDGGEIIFSLPNGLQAYYLTDNAGRRLDVAPAQIVFDRGRGEEIVNGRSCMGCHVDGVLSKQDEVLNFVDQGNFSGIASREIRRLYGTPAELNAAFAEDTQRFLASLSLWAEGKSGNFLNLLGNSYESDITLAQAAREFGYTEAVLREKMNQLSGDESRALGPLAIGRSISRETFEARFQFAYQQMNLDQSLVRIYEGFLEVKVDGEYRPVCDDQFSVDESIVACRSMGMRAVSYSLGNSRARNDYGMDDVSCNGNEISLFDCSHRLGRHDCGSSEHVKLVCE